MNLVLITIYSITFTVDVFLLIFSASRKDPTKSLYLTILTMGLAFYSLGCAIALFASTEESAMTALKLMNAGIPLIAPYFLLISLAIFQPKYLRNWMIFGALIYGFGMFFFIMFNDSHFLYYSSVKMQNGVLSLGRGPVYWMMQGVTAVCMFSAYTVLFGKYIVSTAKLRKQMDFIILGSILVLGANIINFTGVLNNELFDLMPVVMTIALCLFVIKLDKYFTLDLAVIVSNTAVEIMNDALIITDKDWEFLFCNASAKRLFPDLLNFTEGEAMEKITGWPAELKDIISPCEKEFTMVSPETGGIYTYKTDINKIMDERRAQIGWYILIRDTTDVTFLIDQLKELATTDSLTGIINRRSFMERVDSEMDKSARINLKNALIMFDIDKFKDINDTHGHIAGDYILCSVVDTVKKQLRSYDIIARYGGEEFVIFTTCIDEEPLNRFANRLRKAIQNSKYVYDEKIIPTTASFGTVEIYPGDTFDQAMLAVDTAMYEAKRTGRNKVVAGEIKRMPPR
ncbi:MAG: diguanylate cyclase [Oscillospiraceae bacterium]|nr:diguanylate cyclase [Oscillospiraceae bacterium]